MKKLITLGYKDCPTVSLCKGHVTVKEFNQVFKQDWSGGGRLLKADLKHEHWVPLKRGWKKSTPENKKAKPVTVLEW